MCPFDKSLLFVVEGKRGVLFYFSCHSEIFKACSFPALVLESAISLRSPSSCGGKLPKIRALGGLIATEVSLLLGPWWTELEIRVCEYSLSM